MQDTTPESRFDAQRKAQQAYFQSTYKGDMQPKDTTYIKRQVGELIEFAAIGPDDRILEIGCGMGRYTLELAKRGYAVEGLDITSYLLEQFQAFNAGRYDIPLHCGDAIQPPEELHRRYDAVIGFFTLHHLPNLTESFRAAAKLLKPGGTAAFLEPNPYSPLYPVQILFTPGMTFQGEKGQYNMRRRPVFKAILNSGFRNPGLSRFGFFPPFIVNRPAGAKLERLLERFPLWRLALPFVMFKATLPNP